MTRMTETCAGEINFYKPRAGSKRRDVYDRLRAGEEVTARDAERVFEFGLEIICSRPYRPGKHSALYKMVGEWHDFVYYPIERAHMIEADEHDFELDYLSYASEDSEPNLEL